MGRNRSPSNANTKFLFGNNQQANSALFGALAGAATQYFVSQATNPCSTRGGNHGGTRGGNPNTRTYRPLVRFSLFHERFKFSSKGGRQLGNPPLSTGPHLMDKLLCYLRMVRVPQLFTYFIEQGSL